MSIPLVLLYPESLNASSFTCTLFTKLSRTSSCTHTPLLLPVLCAVLFTAICPSGKQREQKKQRHKPELSTLGPVAYGH